MNAEPARPSTSRPLLTQTAVERPLNLSTTATSWSRGELLVLDSLAICTVSSQYGFAGRRWNLHDPGFAVGQRSVRSGSEREPELHSGILQTQQTISNFPGIATADVGSNGESGGHSKLRPRSRFLVGNSRPASVSVSISFADCRNGTCTIQASQAGTCSVRRGSGICHSQSFNVNLVAQTINFPGIAAQNAGAAVNLSATASSGLVVNYLSVTPAICTVTDSTASMVAAGLCAIQGIAARQQPIQLQRRMSSQSFNVNARSPDDHLRGHRGAEPRGNAEPVGDCKFGPGSRLLVDRNSWQICTVDGNAGFVVSAGVCTIQRFAAGQQPIQRGAESRSELHGERSIPADNHLCGHRTTQNVSNVEPVGNCKLGVACQLHFGDTRNLHSVRRHGFNDWAGTLHPRSFAGGQRSLCSGCRRCIRMLR